MWVATLCDSACCGSGGDGTVHLVGTKESLGCADTYTVVVVGVKLVSVTVTLAVTAEMLMKV